MPARAMWKAELCVGSVRVPVKLYAAVQDTTPHFRLLHGADRAPVQQQMIDPVRGEPVPKEQIQKGLQVTEGVFVVLTDEDQQALEPEPSRAIHVEQLVDPDRVDPRWFNRPYYLGPDGDEEGYFALAQALERRGRLGIARWVMRKKGYQGALQARNGYLMLETLRHAEEMVGLERIQPPAERTPDPRELKLAEQLVAALEDRFEPEAYHDEYRERVMALIEDKAHGKVIGLRARSARITRTAPDSLKDDLEASLRAGRGASGGR
jgi:DNA end-binding protein Ku